MNSEFSFSELIPFLNHFYKLKDIERAGWRTKLSIDKTETVADHTLLMIVLTLIFAEHNNFNLSKTIKMIKMALIHDLGESIIGDHTPEFIKIENKRELEDKAIKDIFSKIHNEKIRKRYLKIWKEFDDNITELSKKIHLIDKLEMAIQAKYYLDNNVQLSKKDVMPFFDSVLRYVMNNDKSKNKEHINNDKEIEKLDEIEQIMLYLYKQICNILLH